MAVNERGVFITEETSFASFSPVDYKKSFRIEKDQDGVNLFKYPPMLRLYSDYIFINSFNRCVWVSYEGKLTRKKEYDDFENFQSSTELIFFPIKDKFIKRIVDHDSKKQEIYLVDSDFNEIKKITEASYDFSKMPDDIKDFKLLFHYTGIEVFNDKIYVGDTRKGFHIDVFDADGDLLYAIHKEDEKQMVTSDFKNRALKEMESQAGFYNYLKSKNAEFSFYDHFPSFRHFQVVDNRIYVYTYKRINDNHELLILDLKGNIINTVYLSVPSMKELKFTGSYDLLTVHDNKMYELIQNPNTKIWELHITVIE